MNKPTSFVEHPKERMPNLVRVAFVPLAIAINITLGSITHALKLPIYLDAVGTITTTLLLGWRAGVFAGVGSFLLAGLITNPVLPWFSGTQAAIAIYTFLANKCGGFKSYPRALISGIGLGVVAGTISAPVIAYLFGGITGSGASLIVGFLLSSGHKLLTSVFLSGIASEPVDKAIQCLLAVWLVRGLPPKLLKSLDRRK
ncbi:MAG: hypothetical protein ABSG60_11680 [Terracidiphilus sp.]|jgi:energy-coupling factor transport system substrate-specific component